MFGEALLCPEQISAGALKPNEGGGQSKTALGGAARGLLGGFRIKSPYSDADIVMKISTNYQRPKPTN
ncbi:hypothetical protein J3U62_01525 [Gilliamella sp. B3773]|uniref:hypothetical protein n=1 Tax=unclassified Gilliamella TaxID=2685620 RepID=UPI00226A0B85|nr:MULTISPECIES: hypothetical protein [unclassified Gilliamella]MCX8612216.1 hypothetical protein [Gilliamella sp. B3773]